MATLNNFPQLYYEKIFPCLKKKNFLIFSCGKKFVAAKCELVQIENTTYTCNVYVYNRISDEICFKLMTDVKDKTTVLTKVIDKLLIEESCLNFDNIYNDVWHTLIKVLEKTIQQLK